MSWAYNEVVRAGNSTARVKNYYSDTGLLVLYDIKGEFSAGTIITGDDSGTTTTLTEFTVSLDYDLYYEPDYWNTILANAVYDEGSGELIALDPHFTGKASQDYQTTYIVVQD